MKKTLLLFVALTSAFFATGSELVNSALLGAEEPQGENKVAASADVTKPEDKSVVSYVLLDSVLQGNSIDIIRAYGGEVSYVPIKPKKPSVDTVKVAQAKPVVDTTKVTPPKKPFKKVIVYGGGRDRNGRFTEECAAHANGRLIRFGIPSYGHAYQIPSHFYPVINGYAELSVPNVSNLAGKAKTQAIMSTHRKAADYVKANLNIDALDPASCYVVNMYYSTSPHMVEFYVAARRQQTLNYGTHVGVLYYDKKKSEWVVEHNIHGNVHYDALRNILGGKENPHKYGVTTIYRAGVRKR